MTVGFIAGSGFEVVLSAGRRRRVTTPFGKFDYLETAVGTTKVLVVPRHGFSHHAAPHGVPSKAHAFAFRDLGVRRVVATSAVGSVNTAMKPGDLVIVDQFIDLTKGRDATFYAEAVHTDFTEPYCKVVQTSLAAAARAAKVPAHGSAVYVCTEGPRYETPAEVQMISRIGGDLIGQSGLPEAVLMKELGICYALLAVVSNWGAGLQPTVSSRDILDIVWSRRLHVTKVLRSALAALGRTKPGGRCRENWSEADGLHRALKGDSSGFLGL